MKKDETSRGAIAAFCRLSSQPIPRVLRMMNVARGLGFQTVFIGAFRNQDLPAQDATSGHRILRVGSYFPLVNGTSFWTYLVGVILYNLGAWRSLRDHNPAVVHCSDIETMPAAVLNSLLSRTRLIYNIHDNLSERYNLPAGIRRVLNVFEGLMILLSSVSLVPEGFRRQSLPFWCRHKVKIVRNTPEDRGWVEPSPEARPINIFFGGWIDAGRGLRELLDLVRVNPEFSLTIAGDGDPVLISEICAAPRTRYLGFIDHESIMRETANSHVVAALYNPERPINRYAASNKLAEALSVGRPAFVNSEMKIVGDLSGYDCLICVPYERILSEGVDRIKELLPCDEIANRDSRPQSSYREKCIAARKAYEHLYDWGTAELAMKEALRG